MASMTLPTAFSWVSIRGKSTEDTVNAVGGLVDLFLANATTLLVGDAVYLAGVGIVDKSATASNYVGHVGYVVGGESNDFRTDDPVGTTAALAEKRVMVQVQGIARAIVGASGFTAGTNFNAVPSGATAGRIIPGTTADQRIGVVLSTQATAGSEVKVLIKQF